MVFHGTPLLAAQSLNSVPFPRQLSFIDQATGTVDVYGGSYRLSLLLYPWTVLTFITFRNAQLCLYRGGETTTNILIEQCPEVSKNETLKVVTDFAELAYHTMSAHTGAGWVSSGAEGQPPLREASFLAQGRHR